MYEDIMKRRQSLQKPWKRNSLNKFLQDVKQNDKKTASGNPAESR
jgi:hypothetical protein